MPEISPDHPEQELVRLSGLLSSAVARLEPLARDMVEATSAFRVAYHTTYLKSEGTVAEREAHASIATDGLFRQKLITEELLRVQRAKVDSIKEAMGAVRTLCATARALAGVEPL